MCSPGLGRTMPTGKREAPMPRKLTIPIVVAGLLLVLTVACGAADESPSGSQGPAAGSGSRDQGDTGTETDRMIVRVVDMHLVVRDPAETMEAVTQMARDLGGFMVSTSRIGGERDAVVTVSLRVPTERTDEAIQRLRDMAERVTSEEMRAQDVTEEYVDLQAQIRNLEATEAQLLTLMERSETVSDTLSVQSELTNVRGRIESHKGRVQYLERTSATSLINLGLVAAASEEPLVEPGWRPLEIAKDGIRGLVLIGQGLANVGIYVGIFSPLWVPVTAIVWYLVRRDQRRRTTRLAVRASARPSASESMVVCPNCQHEIPSGVTFCTNCGERLESN